jgi:hypothetical protein
LHGRNEKPVDTGCGRLSASIGSDGLIRSVNSYHPEQGFVTLAPIEQFPNDKFYDSQFVRQYRRRLVDVPKQGDTLCGFGIQPIGDILKQESGFVGRRAPFLVYQLGEVEVRSLFLAVDDHENSYLINRFEVKNTTDKDILFRFTVGGTFSLNRCSYGQLTEAGPIPIPPLENGLEVEHNRISIENPNLSAKADILLFCDEGPMVLPFYKTNGIEPVTYQHMDELRLKAGESRVINMVYTITLLKAGKLNLKPHDIVELTAKAMRSMPKWNKTITNSDESNDQKATEFIIARNIDYITSNCSVPVEDEYVCVITDHQLLPLAWNRDAYYMMQLLLESNKRPDQIYDRSYHAEWENKVRQIVRGHLLWMFEKAERPHRYWGRAYLTNGFCKDNVFQLDQQCYPLLELCDYFTQFGDAETVDRLKPIVKNVLDMLMEYKHEQKWLFKTGETPADDKVDYPYHFSSQVLVWHTFNELAKLNEKLSICGYNLAEWAERVKMDCLHVFTYNRDEKQLFAYLTDLKGNYQTYHDANDLPAIYAPIWGFCGMDDDRWIHTMEFAFSEDNRGGFYAGSFGGLGSIHTPHPWPLGDGQELLFSHLTGDSVRRQKVFNKLLHIVQWDGLFSEAINEKSGQVESRYWFSWPGAFISTVLLNLGGN